MTTKATNTDTQEITTRLLEKLYETYLQENDAFLYEGWAEQQGYDIELVARIDAELRANGITEPRYIGRNTELTWQGVRFMESSGRVSYEDVQREASLRNDVLRIFAEVREADGPNHTCDFFSIQRRLCATQPALDRAAGYLMHFGSIQHLAASLYQLTEKGWQECSKLIERQAIADDFHKISTNENRQERGHQLEAIIGRIAAFEGWDVSKNVGARGEENDLVVIDPGAFAAFIVSCKWEARPAKADYLFSLRERLRLRPGSIGVIISMGGFSKPLIDNAHEAGQGLVLLFGAKDVKDLIAGECTLSDMLQSRWQSLIKHRRVEVT